MSHKPHEDLCDVPGGSAPARRPTQEEIDMKRKKAHGTPVDLLLCPKCQKYGIPADFQGPYEYCLRCDYEAPKKK